MMWSEAEFYGSGIQAEQLGFETERVLGRIGTAQAVHFCEQVFEKGHRPGIIGIGKVGISDSVWEKSVVWWLKSKTFWRGNE